MANERDITPRLFVDGEQWGLTDQQVVHEITGEDQISVLPEYRILASRTENATRTGDELLLAQAGVELYNPVGELLHGIYGIVSKVRDLVEPNRQVPLVELTLVPRAHTMAMRRTFDIFTEMTVPQIIEAVLDRSNIEFDGTFKTNYRPKEFVVQWDETDLDFISRICEHHGIFFFIDHSSGSDRLLFGDHNDHFPELERTPEIPFIAVDSPGGDLVDRVGGVAIETKMLPRRYTVRDHNYRTPSVDLTESADVDDQGLGEIVEYGTHFKDPDEGKWFASIRAQEVFATKFIWRGEATAPSMGAGKKFMLTQHPMGDTDLLLTTVRYRWSGSEEGTGFGTQFEAITAETPYRPPRRIPKPKVSGALSAFIEAGSEDGYADVDEQGRYLVRFLYDGEGRQATRYLRMMQPHAGGGYGMHFPLRPGIEVVLSCAGGDPDRPFISGCVPNPETPSPVSSGNRDRNVIKTGGGNAIDISDEEGRERFKFTTPQSNTVLQLGADNAAEVGAFLSSSANVVGHAAETVANGATLISTISEVRKEVVGKNVTSVAGIPNPITAFDKIDKLVSAADSAVSSFNSLCDSVEGFGKEMTDSHQKQAKEAQKATEDAVMKRVEKKYPDDARKVKVGDPPNQVEVTETEAQFRERIMRDHGEDDEKQKHAEQKSSSNANVTMLGLYTLDDSGNPNPTFKKVRDYVATGTGAAKKAVDLAKKGKKAVKAAKAAAKVLKPLFSKTHKKTQQAIDTSAWAFATGAGQAANASGTGAVPRWSGRVRTPGEKYEFRFATDSTVDVGVQGAYVMSANTGVLYGAKDSTVVSANHARMLAVRKAEVAADKIFVTSTSKIDLMSRGFIVSKSTKLTRFRTDSMFIVEAKKDIKQKTDKKMILKAKDLWDVDGGKEAKLKAEKWKIDSTKGDMKIESKGKFDLAVTKKIDVWHDKKVGLTAMGNMGKFGNKNGGMWLVSNNSAKGMVKGGTDVVFGKSNVKLNAKSKLDVKASKINIKGKVFLG